MTPEEKAAIDFARKDAEIKMAALPKRVAEELEASIADGRIQTVIQPLTEIHADILLGVVHSIKGTPPPATADVIGVYRKSLFAARGHKVAVRSDQLLMVLDAAKLEK